MGATKCLIILVKPTTGSRKQGSRWHIKNPRVTCPAVEEAMAQKSFRKSDVYYAPDEAQPYRAARSGGHIFPHDICDSCRVQFEASPIDSTTPEERRPQRPRQGVRAA